MKKLYKKDSKGKIRERLIYTKGNTIFQEAGLLDGKKVISSSVTKGKNIGRSNETTEEQQAMLEADSKYNKKLDFGYFKTKDEAENEKVILPMLAHSYDKHYKKIDRSGDVFVQPKLDGMRCLVIKDEGEVKIISRKGKAINTMGHIERLFAKSYIHHGVYDGELYAHGYSFQDNMRFIKKYREGLSEKVLFNMYDYVGEGSRKDRCDLEVGGIKRVSTYAVRNEEELKSKHIEFLKEGYEGTMIRHGNTGYELNKRSYSLLKYKDFIDETYEILDVVPMEKRPEQGVIVCRLGIHKGYSELNITFKATPKMSHKEREELLTNKKDYIGKTAEIRFFEYTEDGIPRFPVFIGVRLDK